MSKQDKVGVHGAADADVRPAAERLDVAEWARRKDIPGWLLSGAIQHATWPLQSTTAGLIRLVTEAEFDAACAAVRSIHLQ